MNIKSTDEVQTHDNNEWYIFKDCNKHGPLTLKDINDLLAKNKITKDHHVWHAKNNEWVAIKDVEAFKNIGFELPIAKTEAHFIETQGAPKHPVALAKLERPAPEGFLAKLKNLFGLNK